jgi:predicted Zn-dependent peptidase
MEDLNAASLDDVKDWFRTYYGAANAVLVLAGDIDAATARTLAQKYFGDIPPGPAITRASLWTGERTESTRDVMYDQVAQTRLYRAWNVPEVGSEDSDLLDIAAQILGGGKTSRLYERLVYRDRIADNAFAGQQSLEISSLFLMLADVKATRSQAQVEAALQQTLADFIAKGPTAEELARAKTVLARRFPARARAHRRLWRQGRRARVVRGLRGRLELLFAHSGAPGRGDTGAGPGGGEALAVPRRLHAGGPAAAEIPERRDERRRSQEGSAGHVDVPGPHVPRPASARSSRMGCRSSWRRAKARPSSMSRCCSTPVTRPTSAASPALRILRSTCSRRERRRSARSRSLPRAESLGAELSSGSALDSSFVGISALSEKLDGSLGLLADVVRIPHFRRRRSIGSARSGSPASVARNRTPKRSASRVLPPLLYGEGHPYSIRSPGTGTEASIAALTRDDLTAFQRDWLRPDNATQVVVGDATPVDVLPMLEKHFGTWQAPASAKPVKNLPVAQRAKTASVYLIDKPDAIQSNILVGLLTPSSRAPNRLEIETMNGVIGGAFTSRINMNLRENKHWTYGARSSLPDALGQRPWLLSAPVQTDKTVESINEIRRELAEFVGPNPLRRTRSRSVAIATSGASRASTRRTPQSAPRSSTWSCSIARTTTSARSSRRSKRRPMTACERPRARTLDPTALTWVVIGDLRKIEAPIRALGLGDVKVTDADGKVLR